MRKRPFIILGAVTLVITALALMNYVIAPMMIEKAIRGSPQPPVVVAATPAQMRPIGEVLEAVASIEAVQGLDVAAEISGTVSEIRFKSGDMVAKGQPLLVLSSRPELANVAAQRARLVNSERELERGRQLFKDGWLTRAALDERQAARDADRAQLQSLEAEAGRRIVRAPFAGRVGIRSVDIGQFVDAGVAIVSMATIDPMYVVADLPERVLSTLKVGRTIDVFVDALGGRRFSAKVTALDTAVNASSRSIRIQATLPNPDGVLTPGLSARIHIPLSTPEPQIAVPQTAIAYALSGDTVYVLDPKPQSQGIYTARQIAVRRAGEAGGWVAIQSGLKPGALVVTDGQNKLLPGALVKIDNSRTLPTDRPLPRE